jgi:hypothetical protein
MRNNNDNITSVLLKKRDNPDEGGENPVEDDQVSGSESGRIRSRNPGHRYRWF